jgi:hypothetical protein
LVKRILGFGAAFETMLGMGSIDAEPAHVQSRVGQPDGGDGKKSLSLLPAPNLITHANVMTAKFNFNCKLFFTSRWKDWGHDSGRKALTEKWIAQQQHGTARDEYGKLVFFSFFYFEKQS